MSRTGTLFVVGMGPGERDLMAPKAQAALNRCPAIVGYGRYLELLDQDMLARKQVVSSGMRQEVDRCEAAVELALSGTDTAVVSSGDPGVYAMAGLVFEILDARGLMNKVECEVVPGIPALMAAAALLGAPLTHDFAAVSLSDLLTPWETIERRLEAAAWGDFVIGIYNPRSKKRNWQLGRALDIIGEHRAGTTPVGVVKRAFRAGQEVLASSLAETDPSCADMETVLVVGNSTTRLAKGASGPRLYTPRGYAGKYSLSPDYKPC